VNLGYKKIDYNNAGVSITQLVATGLFNVLQMISLGYQLNDLNNVGFYKNDFYLAGFDAIKLRNNSYLATDLKAQGFTAYDIASAGYTIIDIINSGYKLIQINGIAFNLVGPVTINNLVVPTNVSVNAYSLKELVTAGFTVPQLIDISGGTTQFNLADMKGKGFVKSDFAAYTILQLYDASFSVSDLLYTGYTNTELIGLAKSLFARNYSVTQFIQANFTLLQIDNIGFYKTDFSNAGYLPVQLKQSGYTISDLSSQK
jgi:hypothetical protein